ncbi:MAG: sulfatase-like hydrolase/transferase [Thermoleophilaceae bacterium]|nr:sulfatase-like hydrolase/transferase [Thermoleophilaceae bacterium]
MKRTAATAAAVALCILGMVPSSAAARRPPVVLVVFDAFPSVTLLDAHGRIDGARFPTFARLAAGSTWFPYSTTTVDETGRAFRSLVTGRTQWHFAKPTYDEHPKNLFTALGRKYRIEAGEEATSLCPPRLCPGVQPQTGESIVRLLEGGRPERFASWLERVGPSRRPTFYFKHLMLPHPPWIYLPSGHVYWDGPSENVVTRDDWYSVPWLIQQKYQRELLQVGYADLLIGQLLDRLRANGMYDRSLIVVTADHGESFGHPGETRAVNRSNVGDIALTPLFVKLPFQRRGRVDRRHVRIIDIAPTIARIARVHLGWKVAGRSVFGPAARKIPHSSVLVGRGGQRIRLTPKSLRKRAAASLRLKLGLFGGPRGLFGIGPHRELQGTAVAAWPKAPNGGVRAELDSPGRFQSVQLGSTEPPVKVTGRLTGPGSEAPLDIAIAVNGTIEATAPAFGVSRSPNRLFSALIPEGALREGANTVQLFAIQSGPALSPIGGT